MTAEAEALDRLEVALRAVVLELHAAMAAVTAHQRPGCRLSRVTVQVEALRMEALISAVAALRAELERPVPSEAAKVTRRTALSRHLRDPLDGR